MFELAQTVSAQPYQGTRWLWVPFATESELDLFVLRVGCVIRGGIVRGHVDVESAGVDRLSSRVTCGMRC